MTYKELFAQLRQMHETEQRMSDQDLDSLIAMVSKLPCTGPSKPIFRGPGQHFAISAGLLDSGEALPPGFGCMHCTYLTTLKWIKSLRDGTAKEFCDCGKETCVTCQMLRSIRQADEEAKRALKEKTQ